MAVARLADPYRQVVLLRYYEGFTSAQIARRLGIPAGTIRWRLKTALEQVRATLDAAHGERNRWIALVAPLVQITRPDHGTALPSGGPPGHPLLSSGKSLVGPVATAALVVVSCLAAFLYLSRWSRESASAGAASRAGGPAGRTPPPRLARLVRPAATGREIAADSAIPAWAQLELATAAVVAGRVVSAAGKVEGARLRLSSGMLSFAPNFDRHAVSDAGGNFSFFEQAPTNWFLTVSAAGLEPAILYLDLRLPRPRSRPGEQPTDNLVIDLRPCRAFARGIVRSSAQRALPGARVRLAVAWNNGGTETRTDRLGRYELCLPTQVSSIGYTIVAAAEGHGTVETAAPIETTAMDFELDPQAQVTGRALRDSDGTPMADVTVTLLPIAPADPNRPPAGTVQPVRLGSTTGSQGGFEIKGVAPGRYRLNFAHEEVAWSGEEVLSVKAGENLRVRDVRLRPAVIVEGRVSRGGAPAVHVNLFFKRRMAADRWQDVGWTVSDQEGQFRVRFEKGIAVDRILTPDPGRAGAWTAALTPARLLPGQSHRESLEIELPALAGARDLARAVTPPGVVAPRPRVSREARFGELVRVIGYDLSSDRLPRGGKLEVTMHFEVLADPSGWQLFTHLGGAGGFRNLDHGPVGGAYPVELWRKGETVRDRFILEIDSSFPAGVYRWLVGFWKGAHRLPVTPGAQQDGDDRFLAFEFTVE